MLAAALFCALAWPARASGAAEAAAVTRDWRVQSSSAVSAGGGVLSRPDYAPVGWHPAEVPGTVVGALVGDGTYPDPGFGKNLREIPGCSYPVGAVFGDLPMPADSPFAVPWWYRAPLEIPAAFQGKRVRLLLDGVNFRADVWLNGRKVAGSDEVDGTYRLHSLDVTDFVRPGRANALALEVFAPRPEELAWTWVDWNPFPPDKSMGILRGVSLKATGPVALESAQVVTSLPSLERARLTVAVDVANLSSAPVEGVLSARLLGARLTQPVALSPGERKTVSFSPDRFGALDVRHPALWWPAAWGPSPLHPLSAEFAVGGRISDVLRARFGIREVGSEVDPRGHLQLRVNGRRLLVRGGGWASDLLLRRQPRRLEAQLRYARDMGLNTIRLEGQLEPDDFFDRTDELGLLVIAGWPCCSRWEHWARSANYPKGPVWGPRDYAVARGSQADQVRRLRGHPSMLAWMNGSDNAPPPDVERMYLDVLRDLRWPGAVISSAGDQYSVVSGSSGVKMAGPYEWVPPSYWLRDSRFGGAHGFATEVSPGPAVPPLESLRRMLPPGHLWPIDDLWNYHAGSEQFQDLKIFTAALEARYGAARGAADYARKAQLMAYEGQRAMFEAYAAKRYEATGVIQWMLNNAWPSLLWHLFDYYLVPGGGYFGTKKACEPVHVQFSYADRSVVAVNLTARPLRGLRLGAQVYDGASALRFARSERVDLGADSNAAPFEVPRSSGPGASFLRLTLDDGGGRRLSENWYWLSAKDDAMAWDKTDWYHTPASSYADFTALQDLPPAALRLDARAERRGGARVARARLSNPGKSLAFFIRLRLRRPGEDLDVAPVLWQDNYLSLLPGETREVSAAYDAADAPDGALLTAEGLNTPLLTRPLPR